MDYEVCLIQPQIDKPVCRYTKVNSISRTSFACLNSNTARYRREMLNIKYEKLRAHCNRKIANIRALIEADIMKQLHGTELPNNVQYMYDMLETNNLIFHIHQYYYLLREYEEGKNSPVSQRNNFFLDDKHLRDYYVVYNIEVVNNDNIIVRPPLAFKFITEGFDPDTEWIKDVLKEENYTIPPVLLKDQSNIKISDYVDVNIQNCDIKDKNEIKEYMEYLMQLFPQCDLSMLNISTINIMESRDGETPLRADIVINANDVMVYIYLVGTEGYNYFTPRRLKYVSGNKTTKFHYGGGRALTPCNDQVCMIKQIVEGEIVGIALQAPAKNFYLPLMNELSSISFGTLVHPIVVSSLSPPLPFDKIINHFLKISNTHNYNIKLQDILCDNLESQYEHWFNICNYSFLDNFKVVSNDATYTVSCGEIWSLNIVKGSDIIMLSGGDKECYKLVIKNLDVVEYIAIDNSIQCCRDLLDKCLMSSKECIIGYEEQYRIALLETPNITTLSIIELPQPLGIMYIKFAYKLSYDCGYILLPFRRNKNGEMWLHHNNGSKETITTSRHGYNTITETPLNATENLLTLDYNTTTKNFLDIEHNIITHGNDSSIPKAPIKETKINRTFNRVNDKGEVLWESVIDEDNALSVKVVTPESDIISDRYGYKAVKDVNGRKCIAKLKLLDDSKIASGGDIKLRTNKALVVGIWPFTDDGSYINYLLKEPIDKAYAFIYANHEFVYEIGKIVSVDYFDNNLYSVCVPGIHFVISPADVFHFHDLKNKEVMNVREVQQYGDEPKNIIIEYDFNIPPKPFDEYVDIGVANNEHVDIGVVNNEHVDIGVNNDVPNINLGTNVCNDPFNKYVDINNLDTNVLAFDKKSSPCSSPRNLISSSMSYTDDRWYD